MRHDGRRENELRPVSLEMDYLEQPLGAVLYSQGKTRVLCTASLDERVPRWLRDSGRGWLTADPAGVLERRNEPADRTKALARSSLERLFRREDVALREKCLWRLLYETAARTQEVLSADIADLDLDNKRLRVRRKQAGARRRGAANWVGSAD